MSGDFTAQLEYVRANSHRIIEAQDRDPLSSAFGCLHTAYWRDKTSEFPDSRFQEGAATLGLLLHPDITPPDATARRALERAFSAGASCWYRQQHPDGSFDEWYKGEHGFAATAFGTVAFGFPLYLHGNQVNPDTRLVILRGLMGTGRWLCRHDDTVKTNHEAAGAAALAMAGVVLEDEKFLQEARAKHARVLDLQTDEGWFPEIGGADVGYTFLLIDYMMIYRWLTGDDSGVDALCKAHRFAAHFVRPDLAVSAETGLCANTHISRLGTLLLADRSPEAAALLHRFLHESVPPGPASDDLRFFRWSCLSVVSSILLRQRQREGALPDQPAACPSTSGWTRFPAAGLMVRRLNRWTVEFLPAAGGLVRISSATPGRYLENRGLCLREKERVYSTAGYDATRISGGHGDDVAWVQLTFAEIRSVFPGAFLRLALRVLCSVPWLSFRVRALIDRYRLRHRTAANQSATMVVRSQRRGVSITRLVDVSEDVVTITDRVRVTRGEVHLGDLAWISGPDLVPLTDALDAADGPLPESLKPGDVHEFRHELRLSTLSADALELTCAPSAG